MHCRERLLLPPTLVLLTRFFSGQTGCFFRAALAVNKLQMRYVSVEGGG